MGADDRRSERAVVLLAARIELERGPMVPVRVSNLSANGALVIGEGVGPADAPIVFHCNGQAIEAYVSWTDGGRAGIEFAESVDPEKLTHREAPHVGIVKDTRPVDFRRPGFRGNQLSDEEQRAVDEWNRSQPTPDDGEDPGPSS